MSRFLPREGYSHCYRQDMMAPARDHLGRPLAPSQVEPHRVFRRFVIGALGGTHDLYVPVAHSMQLMFTESSVSKLGPGSSLRVWSRAYDVVEANRLWMIEGRAIFVYTIGVGLEWTCCQTSQNVLARGSLSNVNGLMPCIVEDALEATGTSERFRMNWLVVLF